MEAWVFIVLLILGVPVFLAIWLITRATKAGKRIEELSDRVGLLELEIVRLKRERQITVEPQPAPAQTQTVSPPPAPAQAPASPIVARQETRPVAPPPPPAQKPAAQAPPPLPMPPLLPLPKPVPTRSRKPAINWEQFMGVKLFAWVGGLALFLGVVFFVKYSFDNNLVPPALRVALGFLAGIGLLVGGVMLSRKNYPALSQTLCATGVLILYATTFACRSIYHFRFFGVLPTFLLMVLITATAFLLAVRLTALVVAILGMLGGFLTPILLSTGVDNALGLFGYIAILDAGLILVALHRRWFFLTALAAVGTALMQAGWTSEFFVVEKYFEGNKVFITLAVLSGFNVLYLLANWRAKRIGHMNWWLIGASLGLVAVALAFVPYFLSFAPLAARPWVMFGFAFAIDLVVLALAALENRTAPALPIAGLTVFLLLAIWTGKSLTVELLNPALVLFLLFAALHAAVPLLLERRGVRIATSWNQLFPPLGLVLVLIPIVRLTDVPFLVWPFVLLVDVLAIGLAVLTASLLPVVAVLLLTLAATSALIFKIPADLAGINEFLILLALFAVAFMAAGVWLVRKFKGKNLADDLEPGADVLAPGTLSALLPLFSATLPFLLLIMAVQRLSIANPSPVFGLALLLTVLLLGLAILLSVEWLPAVGLACLVALEASWHFKHFEATNATIPLIWYLGFFAVFAAFPFVFITRLREKRIPWAAAAIAGPPQFFLVYRLVKAAWPNEVMGMLPAAFALPALLSLIAVLKKTAPNNAARLTQLAWFGAVALFFITLIFPIQFERQWLTLAWALEGAALLWLFHRLPHPGLRLTGLGLLIAAFVRLTFNPAVFDYHPRSSTPILNWYLYTYGTVIVCFFVAAQLLAPPRHKVSNVNVPPILAALGTVLTFLLLNIEIADYFSDPGSTLTFEFSGNLARDMTYSIAWALFALALLVAGIAKKQAAARYAAIGLLSVTVLKLFFHDLARLGQLYRIGAFLGVAVIAILASFAYQRFFSAGAKESGMKDETAR
jgi:uncharacterized membrane protein